MSEEQKIIGYVEQSPHQLAAINNLKEVEAMVIKELDHLKEGVCFVGHSGIVDRDLRWLAIARTQIQQGFMAAVRSVARPLGD